jgi:hypothetical protein
MSHLLLMSLCYTSHPLNVSSDLLRLFNELFIDYFDCLGLLLVSLLDALVHLQEGFNSFVLNFSQAMCQICDLSI